MMVATKCQRHRIALGAGLAFALVGLIAPASSLAGPRERAKMIHDRVAGVPPDGPTLDAMEQLVQDGQAADAARLAMQNPAFYSVALKNFVTPWTNVDQTVFADLNDYTATVIGLVRDDAPFDQVLYEDVLYVSVDPRVTAGYSHTDNEHYRQIEDLKLDLSDDTMFVRATQSGQPGAQVGPATAAGVLTTRAAGEAFYSAGTNRRVWRFLSMNFLCRDLEDMKDSTRPVDRIRQDVSRSPGGDSGLFLNHCSGCHSGMDPLAGAFAYFEWDANLGRLIHTPGMVQPKHLINAETFAPGYATVDDRWDNYWREGINASLGWSDALPGGGFGAQTLGMEVAGSRAFAVCQVEKVFAQVCFRPVNSPEDAATVEAIADLFEADYSLRTVFAETAAYCTEE